MEILLLRQFVALERMVLSKQEKVTAGVGIP
jgi:hypothetical protein